MPSDPSLNTFSISIPGCDCGKCAPRQRHMGETPNLLCAWATTPQALNPGTHVVVSAAPPVAAKLLCDVMCALPPEVVQYAVEAWALFLAHQGGDT